MTLPGGKKLVCIGSYRMTGRRLGRGNFAKVEEAVHTVLKTKVALKIMNVSEIKEEYVIRNLHREARLMSRLSHPCIVTLFETMQNGPVYYLVTELIGGGDLCSFIKSQRGGKLEEKPTKNFGRQLVSAVAYMHSLGIVHRDLKMENIMLNDTKTMVKIVDFGLSNMFSGDCMLRTHCGSPEYAAPELFVTGQLYGPQVDLWSLGVILYGMVMGNLPFVTSRDSRISSQERRKHLLSQINRGLGPNHRKALSNFSVEFRAMINRLLLPDPLKRIPVHELVRHPWLTERNRRPLRTNGMKDLDPNIKILIVSEISKLLNLETTHIEYTLRAEPFGFLAGIYNLLAHRRIQQNDMIGKESPTQTAASHNQRPSTTLGIMQNTHPRLQNAANVLSSSCGCDYSDVTSTLPIKKATEIRNPTEVQPLTSSRLRVIGTRQITKTYNLRGATESVNKTQRPSTTNPHDTIIAKRRTKSEPLTQQSTQIAYATSVGNHTAERAQKRRSEQQQQSRSVTTAPRKPYGTANTARSGPSRITSTPNSSTKRISSSKPVRTKEEPILEKTRSSGIAHTTTPVGEKKRPTSTPSEVTRRRNVGDGDCGQSSNQHTKVNRHLLNEPIARCIAGYVDKYMNVHGAKVDQRFCVVQPPGRSSDQRCKIKFKHTRLPMRTKQTSQQECKALC